MNTKLLFTTVNCKLFALCLSPTTVCVFFSFRKRLQTALKATYNMLSAKRLTRKATCEGCGETTPDRTVRLFSPCKFLFNERLVHSWTGVQGVHKLLKVWRNQKMFFLCISFFKSFLWYIKQARQPAASGTGVGSGLC